MVSCFGCPLGLCKCCTMGRARARVRVRAWFLCNTCTNPAGTQYMKPEPDFLIWNYTNLIIYILPINIIILYMLYTEYELHTAVYILAEMVVRIL